jgi:DNA modification methylase
MFKLNKIYNENCLDTIKKIPDNFIDCIVTSPPYWKLRDYGVEGQMGQEETPQEYVNTLVFVFKEIRRILKPEGTVWLNLGDTYTGGGRGQGSKLSKIQKTNKGSLLPPIKTPKGFKRKDLCMIPARVAIALHDDGWYLRSEIIWKKNSMPESVADRPTRSHEMIYLLTKKGNYYYDADAIKEKSKTIKYDKRGDDRKRKPTELINGVRNSGLWEMANKRDVWDIPNQPCKEAHFAVFPLEIPRLCISAGCPKNGIVYDPFGGSGTTGIAALQLDRNFILSELNPEYVKIAEKRISPSLNQMKLF